MNDRELLELAAKAAGYNVVWNEQWQAFEHRVPKLDNYGHARHAWVPNDDDGDALRLACHLECHVKHDFWARVISLRSVITFCQNPEKATRRAIVRAAAEIGKAMQ